MYRKQSACHLGSRCCGSSETIHSSPGGVVTNHFLPVAWLWSPEGDSWGQPLPPSSKPGIYFWFESLSSGLVSLDRSASIPHSQELRFKQVKGKFQVQIRIRSHINHCSFLASLLTLEPTEALIICFISFILKL